MQISLIQFAILTDKYLIKSSTIIDFYKLIKYNSIKLINEEIMSITYDAKTEYVNKMNALGTAIKELNIPEQASRDEVIALMKKANDVYKKFIDFQGRCDQYNADDKKNFKNTQMDLKEKFEFITELKNNISNLKKLTHTFSDRKVKNSFEKNFTALKTASLSQRIITSSRSNHWGSFFNGFLACDLIFLLLG